MDERMIKSPKHYAEGRKFEPKDVIRDWGLNFNLGSAVKYISRAGRKEDIVQDLKKAQEFIQFEVDALEESCVHLCNSCIHECIAGCPAKEEDITFGNGVGGDNIVKCNHYRKEEDLEPVFAEMVGGRGIAIAVPKDTPIEEIIEKVLSTITDELGGAESDAEEPTATEFQKRAINLYNAYLYKLDKLRKELKAKCGNGAKDVGCVFSPTMVLKEGFDPEEVLESMAKKLMAE